MKRRGCWDKNSCLGSSEEMVSRMSPPKSYFPDSYQDFDEVISLTNYQAIYLPRKLLFFLT